MAPAEPISIALGGDGEDGEELRFTLRPELLEASARDEGASPWEVEGEIDWERSEAVRLLAATFEEARELAVVTLRPRDAAGHDADLVAAYLASDGEPVPVTDTLLSTEYDADGLPRRVGVELVIDPGAAPLRVAGDRDGEVEIRSEGVRHEVARMDFRLEGSGGRGVYEILQRA